MRNSKPEIIRNETQEICAILLQGDYCAEHERGIVPILNITGIPLLKFGEGGYPRDYQGPWGMKRITIPKTNITEKAIQIVQSKETKASLPLTYLEFNIPRILKTIEAKELKKSNSRFQVQRPSFKKTEVGEKYFSDLGAAWDDNGFAIFTSNAETGEFLVRMHASLLQKEGSEPLAIWTGGAGNNPFARCGLVIGFPEKFDEKNNETHEEGERALRDSYWAAHDTGIPALIPKNKYFALSPGPILKTRILRQESGKPATNCVVNTKHDIMFFLNPTEQKKNRFGWFTVEELEAWHIGEGPIIQANPLPPEHINIQQKDTRK